jgi:hypothetical protein
LIVVALGVGVALGFTGDRCRFKAGQHVFGVLVFIFVVGGCCFRMRNSSKRNSSVTITIFPPKI